MRLLLLLVTAVSSAAARFSHALAAVQPPAFPAPTDVAANDTDGYLQSLGGTTAWAAPGWVIAIPTPPGCRPLELTATVGGRPPCSSVLNACLVRDPTDAGAACRCYSAYAACYRSAGERWGER